MKMTFQLIMLLTLVRISLLFHVHSVMKYDLKSRRIHWSDEWRREHNEVWAPVTGLFHSATGRPASRMHMERPTKKFPSWYDHRLTTVYNRAPESTRPRRQSYPSLVRVPTKYRSSMISTVPVISARGVIIASKSGDRVKKPQFRGKRFQDRTSLPSHPVYIGTGQDAAEAAYRAYFDIIATSTRNSRKTSVNPVTFIGRR